MQHKINKASLMRPMTIKHWYNTLGLISCGGLALLILCLVLPVVGGSTKAKDGYDTNPPAWIPSNYVSLSLDQMPTMDIMPTGDGGSVGVSQAKLQVSTTSNMGYKIYVNTLDHTTAMTSTDTNQSATIASTNIATTAKSLMPNTWGYTITDAVSDSTTYSPMPATSAVAYDTVSTSGEHYLSFAAKIDTSLPAGQYSNTVAISAIANPAVITGMMELTYMQDMTSSICQNTVGYDKNYNRDSSGSYIITPGNEVTKQLIDARDGKEYWVAKLADGNCWMTQNLALDLIAGKVLTPADTDVTANWTVPKSTETEVPEKETSPSINDTRSWYFGDFVVVKPENDSACTITSLTEIQKCTSIVKTDGWSPTFVAQNITINNQEQYIAANPEDKTYDAHYSIGNYYQWNTATAGSGTSTTTTSDVDYGYNNALDSICPANWRLPAAGKTVDFAPRDDNDYYQLLLAYKFSTASLANNWVSSGTSPYAIFEFNTIVGRSTAAVAYQAPSKNPISLAHSGIIDLTNGKLITAGHETNQWSSSVDKVANTARSLESHSNYVSPAHYSGRYNGLSVRCLAK